MLIPPTRGPAVRELGLALPPARMPTRQGSRPLKRWLYVGVYTPELMLCVGDARVGPVPQRWWAVALPGGALHERTTNARGGVSVDLAHARVDTEGVQIDLELAPAEGVETASPAGSSYVWTSKRACVEVRGTVRVGEHTHRVEGPYGFVDESAGYHPRRTSWRWSAGTGLDGDGRRVGWNLVDGIHDAPQASERTLWVEGEPVELPPAEFAPDLSAVGGLRFSEWSAREDHTNLLLFRSDYRQPFGTFSGELGGVGIPQGWGVMEEHDVLW